MPTTTRADIDMAASLAIGGMDLDTVTFVLETVSKYGPHVDEMLDRMLSLACDQPLPECSPA